MPARIFLALWRAFVGTVQFVAVAVFVFIIAITFTNIFRRYFGFSSYIWVEETARVLLMWLTFLGGTLAVARGSHLVLDFFTDRGSRTVRRILASLVALASFAFFWILVHEGWQYSLATSRRVLPSLQISAGWMVNSAVAGGVLFAVAFIGRLLQQYLSAPADEATRPDGTADAPAGAKD
jgi:TRAP-type C4-dicarboxylate transport system permease small subunit